MIDFIMTNISILAGEKCALFSPEEYKYIAYFYRALLIATPALVLALCTVDIARAVVAQDDNAIKKAQSNSVKRIIAGVVMFFVPILLNLLLGAVSGDINLGGACSKQVANDKANYKINWDLERDKNK